MTMPDVEIQNVSVKIRSGVESMRKEIRSDVESFALM